MASHRVKVCSSAGLFPILFRECRDKSSPGEGNFPGTVIKFRYTTRVSILRLFSLSSLFAYLRPSLIINTILREDR